ncbi:MFS transporter [Cryobacterium sp. TMT1-21]|uniref:MFS transporter n=1 Tax=Cryobacterium shii TaxID=1259235 RepID=A0AAQ2C8N7_9MICO|nr:MULTISPECIES: MFS transporter [Cryobacterium]TFC52361.1 MFS transporter [Cryobacterium shii]TFC87523.1 MFS transporter [Cryobacterium sp. TmT2-59]TFD10871.1 MFS transporter [Cryobacterium sp. TMT1-21]TFD16522.1 MFS transporter [Cryobacterium sp. TMT2-23]TFD20490.1 MFS transporter [Cryobacterium sp. TMT4-10]
MFVRRVFFYWQFIAVLALPAWLMIGASIYGTGGWDVVGSFFSGLFIGLGLLAVSLLFYARKEVRTTRAVSWADVGFLTLWHGLIVAMGFSYTWAPGLAALVILVGIGVFWFAIWELVAAARKSVQAMMILVDETARGGLVPGDLPPTELPPVIIVREKPPES